MNLLGFQPVEIIRLLLVFFLAGYFAHPLGRAAARARNPPAAWRALTSRFDIPPRGIHPAGRWCAAALSLVFFFLQRDMGPALVFACLFLVLYGMARGSALVPVVGLALVVADSWPAICIGVPHTVRERVSMWLSPWDNTGSRRRSTGALAVGFSTGGVAGMGIGPGRSAIGAGGPHRSDPFRAGRRDGVPGRGAVFALFALIVWRALRIGAGRAPTTNFFWRPDWPPPPRCRSC